MGFTGEIYKASSGQWSFVIKNTTVVEYCRGGGYATKAEAKREMQKLLAELNGED